ncbi:Crp/Fnr family transcriptional regulator [Halomonas llamarensis]|uniref:Crp/Fnr family transcriptional regulator n=1 Tax=Halomonas llamarensis TaxID=2945104 RepID=A0ABT0SLM0_9GAMM|nr:Crp/Fnr family transcriptional regulator [Halomonas llamarensis]MCL7928704.1 Crp/Fnr family transcriptional regulator [Halomonas llamarensis]
MTIVKSPEPVSKARDLLANHTLFKSLPEAGALLDSLLKDATPHYVGHGKPVFHEGEEATHYLVVEGGCVEVMRYSADGEERVIQQFMPGQMVAEVATFMTHGRYPMSARAKGETCFTRLSCKRLRQMCQEHPALAMRLLENISMRLYRNINELEWLTASTAAQRLAAYLLDRHAAQTGNDRAIRLSISQRQLAGRLGVRAETISRLLSEWSDMGYVRGGRGVWELCHTDKLQELAERAERAF